MLLLMFKVDGQDAAFIQGDEETKMASELLGLKVNNLLRGLTHKVTVRNLSNNIISHLDFLYIKEYVSACT